MCHGLQCTHSLLEGRNFVVGESISLGDDWDEVDLGVQAAHDLNVQWLQRVAGGLDEVDAGMDAVVNNVDAVHLVLGIKVSVESLLNVLDDGTPRNVIVHKVTESRRVDDGQAETHAVLFNVGADGLYGDGLGADVKAWGLLLLWRVQRRVEERVDKGRLSEARFTCI